MLCCVIILAGGVTCLLKESGLVNISSTASHEVEKVRLCVLAQNKDVGSQRTREIIALFACYSNFHK